MPRMMRYTMRRRWYAFDIYLMMTAPPPRRACLMLTYSSSAMMFADAEIWWCLRYGAPRHVYRCWLMPPDADYLCHDTLSMSATMAFCRCFCVWWWWYDDYARRWLKIRRRRWCKEALRKMPPWCSMLDAAIDAGATMPAAPWCRAMHRRYHVSVIFLMFRCYGMMPIRLILMLLFYLITFDAIDYAISTIADDTWWWADALDADTYFFSAWERRHDAAPLFADYSSMMFWCRFYVAAYLLPADAELELFLMRCLCRCLCALRRCLIFAPAPCFRCYFLMPRPRRLLMMMMLIWCL